ncbi:MAG: hypothetical protein ACKOPS_08980, partial [Cyanobium sp.]
LQADGQSWRNVQIDLSPSRQVRPGRSVARVPQAEGRWTDQQVRDALGRAGLDRDTPLTILAVETLPEPNARFADPLGGDLGQVRVIRTSPLAEVCEDCCL